METKLSKRLQVVASFVPFGARLADVGSDHAYLPLFLVEKGQIDFAVAGEVVPGPYESAREHVTEAGRLSQIAVRLADGLAAVKADDQISVVTIAGMGGRLIAAILEAGQAALAGVERLILQPNNREDDVRQWLVTHGFQLVAETILEEQGKIYEVLVAEKGKQVLSPIQLRFGPYLLTERSDIFVKKWQKEWDKLQLALEKIPDEHSDSRQRLMDKRQMIEEVLDVS